VIENENCPRKKTYTTQTSRIKKEKLFPFSAPGSNLTVHVCHPMVPYMLTGFTGYSVGVGLIVVRVNWSGHPRKLKKSKKVIVYINISQHI
jgi:hypothetical protein